MATNFNNTALAAADVTQLGYVALENFLKNKPIDQVAAERPFLKTLMAKKKPWGGGKEFITEQIRTGYGSNMEWFGDSSLNTSSAVTYTTRDTVRQARYSWASAHDGFKFSEDFLLGNGIIVTDSAPRNSSAASLVQLTNVFNESMDVLRLGFEEILDTSLHLDGSIDPGGGTDLAGSRINGLDAIIRIKGTADTVGGIVKTVHGGTNYWNNHWDSGSGVNVAAGIDTGVVDADLITQMEKLWRKCQLNGGSPDLIVCGTTFVEKFRAASIASAGGMSRYAVQPSQQVAMPWNLDPSVEMKQGGTYTGLSFMGIPLLWDPTFDTCDTQHAAATYKWHRRCYFINSKHLTLRPIEGNDMIARKPPRDHGSYNYYWGMTWRGGLTANRLNAHAVLYCAA